MFLGSEQDNNYQVRFFEGGKKGNLNKVNKEKRLEREIKKIAKEVITSKIEAKLDPMNSYDRRLVHTIIAEYEDLETESFGENPNRYVVIRHKEQ